MALHSKGGAPDLFRNISGFIDDIQEKFPEIKIDDIPGLKPESGSESGTNFAVFMCSLIFGMFWITYITFFNSRVVGSICTKIINSFVKVGYVKVKSFLLNQIKCFFSDHKLFICRYD